MVMPERSFFETMQILPGKTIEQRRQLGARGGRAYARNLRLRPPHSPDPSVVQLSLRPSKTAHQAGLPRPAREIVHLRAQWSQVGRQLCSL